MADFSAFSSPDFQISTWINSIIREKSDDDALESYLAQQAMKLHIISQDYTDQLETGMVEAVSSMPRILSDISRIEDQLKGVQDEMNSLSNQLKQFDQRNVTGVDDLTRLDTLKTNLEECKGTLQEHARWNQVVREAKTFLEGGGRLSDSADRIEVMQKSLVVLQNMPGHEEREQTCNSLTDTLVSAVRPRIRNDVIHGDFSTLQEYLYVYTKLDRRAEFGREYVTIRAESLRELWKGSSGTTDFAQWYSVFLGKISNALAEEANNLCNGLFGGDDVHKILANLIEEIFLPLSNSLADVLHHTASPTVVLECFQLADEFARMKLSHFDASCDVKILGCSLSAIFSGFLAFLDSYPGCENSLLTDYFRNLVAEISFEVGSQSFFSDQELSVGDDDLEAVELIGRYSDKLLNATDQFADQVWGTLSRGSVYLGGIRTKPVTKSVVVSLNNFIKLLIGKIDELRVACGFPAERTNTSTSTSKPTNSQTPSKKSTPAKASSGGESVTSPGNSQSLAKKFASHEIDPKDLIPSALIILQAAGRFSRHLGEVDAQAQQLFNELFVVLFQENIFPLNRSLFSNVDVNHTVPPSKHFAAYWLQENGNETVELKSFLAGANAPGGLASSHSSPCSLVAGVSSSLNRLKLTCGSMLFDLCTNNPEKILSSYALEDCWSAAPQSASDNDGDGLLPLLAMTQLGDHLLSLVQELESFASSDAITDLIHLAGEAHLLSMHSKGWNRLKELLEDDGLEHLCKRSSASTAIAHAEAIYWGSSKTVSDAHTSSSSKKQQHNNDDNSGESNNDQETDEEGQILSFVNDWLGAFSDSILAFMLCQILTVPKFSNHGRNQLTSDFDYFSNILNAMGIKAHPLFHHVKYLIGLPPANLTGTLERVNQVGRASVSGAGTLQKFDQKFINCFL